MSDGTIDVFESISNRTRTRHPLLAGAVVDAGNVQSHTKKLAHAKTCSKVKRASRDVRAGVPDLE
jgi:hypothetical protein